MYDRMMCDTSIDVYPLLPIDLESIVLLLSSILLAMIVTAESIFCSVMQLTALASYQVSYIIIKECTL